MSSPLDPFVDAVAQLRARLDREAREREGRESPIRKSLQKALRPVKVADHVFRRRGKG